jgi:hypothetical protein
MICGRTVVAFRARRRAVLRVLAAPGATCLIPKVASRAIRTVAPVLPDSTTRISASSEPLLSRQAGRLFSSSYSA